MSITVVAHRGDSESARENTPAAFRSAVEGGADVVEIDIRTSRDGVSVILHDATLLRLWGVPHRVGDMVHVTDPDTGESDWVVGTLAGLGSGETRIPTLAETLEQFVELNRGRRNPVTVLIDTVDVADVRVALPVVRAFQQRPEAELVPISWCGDTEAMLYVREQLPEADLAYNHPGGELDLGLVQRLRPSAINLEWTLIDEPLVHQVHRMGLDVAVWTTNDAEIMSMAIDAGVDRITTDRPRLLRRLINQGTSSLALAVLGPDELAARVGLSADFATMICIARDMAEWVNSYTRTAIAPVVEVRQAVEDHLRQVVADSFGEAHDVVVSAEAAQAPTQRPTWYVCAVDGATNLANGLPWTSTSVALAVDGEPVVASIAQPAQRHVFLAAQGLGATLDGVPLEVPRADGLAGRTLFTELSGPHPWPGMLDFLTRVAEQHCTARVMGSGALSLAGVCAQWAVAAALPGHNRLRHLAGVLVARESGAEVVLTERGGIVVAAPGSCAEVLSCLDG
ncbi:inositol monophosphatase family protein [Luteococcus sp. OSA5]|uniref:inositol monophosphatase family protein n=1 Tax=Luteococcus sp. OSA5 TaxID=3401630 RepID=UPI003B432193